MYSQVCMACICVCTCVHRCVCTPTCMVHTCVACVWDVHGVNVCGMHVWAQVCMVCACVWVRAGVRGAHVCTCVCVVHAHMDLRLLDSTGEIDGLFPRSGHHRQQAWVGTRSVAPELHNVLLWPWILSVGAPRGQGFSHRARTQLALPGPATSLSPCRQVPRLGRNVQAEL